MALEKQFLTPAELEALIGKNLRAKRLQRNIEQRTLAAHAGISVHALQNLEGGKGSSLRTLLLVAKFLDQLGWIDALAPKVSINPLTLTVRHAARTRARARRARD